MGLAHFENWLGFPSIVQFRDRWVSGDCFLLRPFWHSLFAHGKGDGRASQSDKIGGTCSRTTRARLGANPIWWKSRPTSPAAFTGELREWDGNNTGDCAKRSMIPTACAMLVQPDGAPTNAPAALLLFETNSRAILSWGYRPWTSTTTTTNRAREKSANHYRPACFLEDDFDNTHAHFFLSEIDSAKIQYPFNVLFPHRRQWQILSDGLPVFAPSCAFLRAGHRSCICVPPLRIPHFVTFVYLSFSTYYNRTCFQIQIVTFSSEIHRACRCRRKLHCGDPWTASRHQTYHWFRRCANVYFTITFF